MAYWQRKDPLKGDDSHEIFFKALKVKKKQRVINLIKEIDMLGLMAKKGSFKREILLMTFF